ncbi:hypothetical protein IQ255_10085 [Pleurocapsales cyanobacterium LEGE 10410]|nr:hypothetical protein [Pleurocapsales cyanobacterium LEGE 10410]
MRNWSVLIPNLSSWINAFLLATLLIIATLLIPAIHELFAVIYIFFAWLFYFAAIFLAWIINLLPQIIQAIVIGIVNFISAIVGGLIALISPLALLLPIPIVAFAHHYLYLLLDRYYPDLNPTERGRIRGYYPGIVSWWYGLYALLVTILAMLVSDSVLSILPGLNFNLVDCGLETSEAGFYISNRIDFWVQVALMILRQPIYRPLMRLILWTITAAYLYQFEFTFRQHLIDRASGTNSNL